MRRRKLAQGCLSIILLAISGFVFLSCINNTEPRKIAVLHEVTDPGQSLWIRKNHLFVANATDSLKMRNIIQVYSLKDGSLTKKFGGPDVFKIMPDHGVIIVLQPEKFVVNSSGKVSIYNYGFELLQEFEHGGDTFFYVPWRNRFIARQIHVENKIEYYRLNMYDSELKIIKELCRKEVSDKAFSGDFSFNIYNNELYVSKINDDFVIEVFDSEGNNIKSITQNYTRVKVTQEHIDKHFKNLTSRPGWERFFNSREEMETFYRNRIKYPAYFPAIQQIFTTDARIYVLTRTQFEDQREIWILDLEGQLINREVVQFKMRSQDNPYPFTIQNNRFFQLILSDQTEQWELYSTLLPF